MCVCVCLYRIEQIEIEERKNILDLNQKNDGKIFTISISWSRWWWCCWCLSSSSSFVIFFCIKCIGRCGCLAGFKKKNISKNPTESMGNFFFFFSVRRLFYALAQHQILYPFIHNIIPFACFYPSSFRQRPKAICYNRKTIESK